MNREDFIKELESLTRWGVGSIQWIYGVSSENIHLDLSEDSELYGFDCCLQVELIDKNREKAFISIVGESYCLDSKDVIGTNLSVLEVSNSSFEALGAEVDTDKVFDLMYDYLLQYGDTKEKNKEEPVFFERW